MSHISTIETKITDIAAVKAACAELGFTLHEGNKHCRGWTWNSDECDHTISVDSLKDAHEEGRLAALKTNSRRWHEDSSVFHKRVTQCDIGLKRNEDGSYGIICDELLHHYSRIGQGAQKFVQLYAAHKTILAGKKLGMNFIRQNREDGTIKLSCNAY